MRYVDQAKLYLQHYQQLKASLPNLEAEYKQLYDELCPGGSLWNFGQLGGRSTIPRDLLDTMEEVTTFPRLRQLKTDIKRIKVMLRKVDRAMASLDPEDRQILVLRYLRGQEWKEIEAELELHYRNCQRREAKALKKIAISLWGIKAMRSERKQQKLRDRMLGENADGERVSGPFLGA